MTKPSEVPESGEWSLRIHGNGKIVGAGILFPDGHVLTCAHVVNAALGRLSEDQLFPRDEIEVQLPGLSSGSADVPSVQARVIDGGWHPVEPGDCGDIAVLRLISSPPAEARPPQLSGGEYAERGRSVHVWGFPAKVDNGIEAQAFLAGRSPVNRCRQLEARAVTGRRIEKGFSGAGVIDDATGAILGMVVLSDKDRQAGASFMLPMEAVIDRLPAGLRSQVRLLELRPERVTPDAPSAPAHLVGPSTTGAPPQISSRPEPGGPHHHRQIFVAAGATLSS